MGHSKILCTMTIKKFTPFIVCYGTTRVVLLCVWGYFVIKLPRIHFTTLWSSRKSWLTKARRPWKDESSLWPMIFAGFWAQTLETLGFLCLVATRRERLACPAISFGMIVCPVIFFMPISLALVMIVPLSFISVQHSPAVTDGIDKNQLEEVFKLHTKDIDYQKHAFDAKNFGMTSPDCHLRMYDYGSPLALKMLFFHGNTLSKISMTENIQSVSIGIGYEEWKKQIV